MSLKTCWRFREWSFLWESVSTRMISSRGLMNKCLLPINNLWPRTHKLHFVLSISAFNSALKACFATIPPNCCLDYSSTRRALSKVRHYEKNPIETSCSSVLIPLCNQSHPQLSRLLLWHPRYSGDSLRRYECVKFKLLPISSIAPVTLVAPFLFVSHPLSEM